MRVLALAALPTRLLALGVVAAALAGIIATELRGHTVRSSLRPVAAAGSREEAPPTLASADPAKGPTSRNVATLLARPLFSPDRRPDRRQNSPITNDGIGLLRLTGVMVSSAGKFAIF